MAGKEAIIDLKSILSARKLRWIVERLKKILGTLTEKSRDTRYNPHEKFKWPETIKQDTFWFSPELMTVHGSELASELSEAQLKELSKWEVVNFFSLNIHGIKDLLYSVIDLIYTNEFALESEYFNHFIDEENTHMWFFANFCQRYGGKVYDSKRVNLASQDSAAIKHFITFSRIFIFEKMVGHYNGIMMQDERLEPILRDIHRMHFTEESRHLAMGHELVRTLGRVVRESVGVEEMSRLEVYLRDYAKLCMDSFYNPAMYRDAGIAEPHKFRRGLLADPGRQEFNDGIISNALRPFETLELFAA